MNSGNFPENGNGHERTNETANSAEPPTSSTPTDGGKLIVLTAPITETIDHAGYFIQMAMASLPIWMEFVLNSKYPKWRELQRNSDGSARYMPAGVRLVEKSLLREYGREDGLGCFRDDVPMVIR